MSPASLRPWVGRALAAGARAYADGASVLDAAVAACHALEESGRFNAGRGARARLDGRTTEMDAACMSGDGRFGGVVCVQGVRNPILAARRVLDTPHNTLAGAGATAFARRIGLPAWRPGHAGAGAARLRRWEGEMRIEGKLVGELPISALLPFWNYPGGPPEALRRPVRRQRGTRPARRAATPDAPDALATADTVGVVASDGIAHAAAASTGGLMAVLRGRASDLATIGGGLYAGPAGAAAVTGHGDTLARELVAFRIHEAMARGIPPRPAIRHAIARVPARLATGAVAVSARGASAWSNRDMPWARLG